jgi:hypothetical protein
MAYLNTVYGIASRCRIEFRHRGDAIAQNVSTLLTLYCTGSPRFTVVLLRDFGGKLRERMREFGRVSFGLIIKVFWLDPVCPSDCKYVVPVRVS